MTPDHLKRKFASDGIFYDVTKRAHYKLLKKAGKEGENDQWEAEKVQIERKNEKNKRATEKESVREGNLREHITVMVQGVVENGTTVCNNMLKARVTDTVGDSLIQLQVLEGSKIILVHEGENLNNEHKWAEL